jgi:hypothetical protein
VIPRPRVSKPTSGKTMNEGVYKLLNSKGETVGTAYVEHAGPLSRWGWFAYVNGFTASNGCPLETSKQAFEELEETMSGNGLFIGLTQGE